MRIWPKMKKGMRNSRARRVRMRGKGKDLLLSIKIEMVKIIEDRGTIRTVRIVKIIMLAEIETMVRVDNRVEIQEEIIVKEEMTNLR